MHLILLWTAIGCRQEPQRSLDVLLPGVGEGLVSVLLDGHEGSRQGELWHFPSVSAGMHELVYRIGPCQPVSTSYEMGTGEGSVEHVLAPACVLEDEIPPMRWIPAGSFSMGSSMEDGLRDSDESMSQVVLSRPFLLSQTEVTQAMYVSVMGTNPSERDVNNCSKVGNVALPEENGPVYCVDWYEALEFANALSRLRGLEECYDILMRSAHWKKGCTGYRLPTEAEWEFAARGGDGHLFAGSGTLDDVAWTEENSGGGSHPVAQKSANGFGLHDMSGNVWEWVWDAYGDYDPDSMDPAVSEGTYRVMRGGCWAKGAEKARVSDRSNFIPFYRMDVTGIRLARFLESLPSE